MIEQFWATLRGEAQVFEAKAPTPFQMCIRDSYLHQVDSDLLVTIDPLGIMEGTTVSLAAPY